MNRRTITALLLVTASCGDPQPGAPSVAVTELLGAGDSRGFERADGPREFVFPDDHGAHPTFQTEWWYVTGNVTSASGRPFGFHLTLFRRGLRQADGRSSDLAPNDLWMGHFAIADVEGGQVHLHERTARGAGGLAGAELTGGDGADPRLRVWLEDWELLGVEGLGATDRPRLRLAAREGDDGLELELNAARPPVLQGDAGYSRKGAGDGQASYYFAVTRSAASGTLRVDGQEYEVDGSAWLDREWSTSVLGQDQVGWDWFALQLDDGTDLMLYQMRLANGAVDATSHGSVTLPSTDAAAPQHRKLEQGEYTIHADDRWTSPRTGGVYPSGWSVTVPSDDLQLVVTPLLRDQELPLTVVYWEGAVRVTGTRAGQTVSGVGFVELTGYADGAAAPPVR